MSDNKKQSRVLVNVLGIPLLLSAIYFGGIYFKSLIFIAIIMSTLELNTMCSKRNIEIQILPLFLFYLYLLSSHFVSPLEIEMFLLVIICVLLVEVFRMKEKPIENIAVTIFSMVWIGLFMNYIIIIRDMSNGMYWTFQMFLAVWICDSAAFFFGSKFGKAKILPNISPNKTWIGTVSGIVFVFIYLFFTIEPITSSLVVDFIHILFLSLIFGGISQIGDFVESMIKRQFGVKDSGTSLRGHGGFLDRMDSLILAAPSFYLYLHYLQNIFWWVN